MLLVQTYLAASAIAGIGLVAAAPIKAGTRTWEFTPGFDQLFTERQIFSLPEAARAQLETYTYRHTASGLFVFCIDNARFMNHADGPNTGGQHTAGMIEGFDLALRDIQAGEELTCDYRTFDANYRQKLGFP